MQQEAVNVPVRCWDEAFEKSQIGSFIFLVESLTVLQASKLSLVQPQSINMPLWAASVWIQLLHSTVGLFPQVFRL